MASEGGDKTILWIKSNLKSKKMLEYTERTDERDREKVDVWR